MKRDMELIKKILIEFEQEEVFPPREGKMTVGGYDNAIVDYHIVLLEESGLITGDIYYGEDREIYNSCLRLTWYGHEFLDAAKNEGLWNKVKAKMKEKSIDLPFTIFRESLMLFVKSEFLS
jgi:hypothetical protein